MMVEKTAPRNKRVYIAAAVVAAVLLIGAGLILLMLSTTALEAALERAGSFSGGNRDWEPFEFAFEDGVVMVLVPAGCFMMGSTQEQVDAQVSAGMFRDIANTQLPQHEQCFETSFWIDKYQVSNGQFAAFGGQAAQASNWTEDNVPRENINWFEARDFCELRGARLPTEAEWEYAARGPDGWIYPWGNEFIADNVVFRDNSDFRTAPVGSRPGGVSWVGALDMSGNVWDWTSSLFEPYPYDAADGREADTGHRAGVLRVLRGGSQLARLSSLYSAFRVWINPADEDLGRGFRCARSVE